LTDNGDLDDSDGDNSCTKMGKKGPPYVYSAVILIVARIILGVAVSAFFPFRGDPPITDVSNLSHT